MSQGLKETALETTDSGVLVNSVDTFDNAVKYGEAVVLSGAAGSAEEGYSSALIQFSSYDFQESLFSADDALSAAFEVGGAFDDNSPITDGMVGGVDPSEQLLDSISEDVSDPGTIP
jgi:hypothetical protein